MQLLLIFSIFLHQHSQSKHLIFIALSQHETILLLSGPTLNKLNWLVNCILQQQTDGTLQLYFTGGKWPSFLRHFSLWAVASALLHNCWYFWAEYPFANFVFYQDAFKLNSSLPPSGRTASCIDLNIESISTVSVSRGGGMTGRASRPCISTLH